MVDIRFTDYYILADHSISGRPQAPVVFVFTDKTRGIYMWNTSQIGFTYNRSGNQLIIEIDSYQSSPAFSVNVVLNGNKIKKIVFPKAEVEGGEMLPISTNNFFDSNRFEGTLENYYSGREVRVWTKTAILHFLNGEQLEAASSEEQSEIYHYKIVNNSVAYVDIFDSPFQRWLLIQRNNQLYTYHFNENTVSYGLLNQINN